MKNSCMKKLISLSMAVLITASSASCASNKKEYEKVKADTPWYECETFEVSDLYSSDVYEYAYFDTVGSTDDKVYILAKLPNTLTIMTACPKKN